MSTQGPDNVKMDANIHVMLSQTKELQRPREAGRDSQIRFFLSSHFHSKTYPDNTFVLELWLLEVEENYFLLF